MSKQSGKVQAKSWQPPAVQTARKGFSARPFPEIARKEEGHEARLDHSEMKQNQPGGMIDNINRSLASASPPEPLPILGLGGVQAKLTLGTVGDVYEQEADRVARQVVDEIHSTAFRARKTTSEGGSIANGGEAGRVQRQITVRAAGDAGGEISSEWEGELQRAKGGGQPLSPTVREPMERAFGADFGGVRVHTGAQADMLARSIQAKAFTTGQDVFFRQGAYEPWSRGGQELIAHELTHVVQQGGGKRKQNTDIQEKPDSRNGEMQPKVIWKKRETHEKYTEATHINQSLVSGAHIQRLDEVRHNFIGIRIYLNAHYYNPNNNSHNFSFHTQLLFNSQVGENEFLNDLAFWQFVQSSSARRAAARIGFNGAYHHRTDEHDDLYRSEHFIQAGQATPDISFVMTQDIPGVDGFRPVDEIHWVFNFYQIVMDRTTGTLIHRTPQLTIIVEGIGEDANMMPGRGWLYNSAGV
ncbi:DUF4157 domain-containing protein [Nostoc sp. CHAB 5784]|uniref:eCIS core domain-containing protein n=1 Tax=Nostoc mirabile TaxID=2907820 RepID=UPI001E2AC5A5|nr:DUF4157 domain-containing protein [Nostoc mirabile]MCC5666854.1 DUF4157 domain-containing protein [Nostoc mirabile CHAB5784]